MKEIKILELFGGIGAIRKAFERQNIPHKVIDYVEIDKYAVRSYNAIFNENFETQDIITWDKNISIDFIMHGSPCQDFSIAGNQAGGDLGSGTRSSLMYETIRIIGKLRPKYVMWENVKNLLSKKHKHNFEAYIETMNILGYNSYYKVLNAKDYGIPQNRERIYTISIRKDIDKGNFKFPEKEELKLKLKDLLEEKVDEKYYLKKKMKNYILDINNTQKGTKWEGRADNDTLNSNISHAIGVRSAGGNQRAGVSNFILDGYDEEIKVKDIKKCIQVGELDIKGHDCVKRVYSSDGLSPTLTDMQGGNRQPKIIQRVPLKFLNINQKKYEGDYAFCVDSSNTGGITEIEEDNIKIRKLTPKECWILMGFDDCDFERAKLYNSDTQLYKQAGNSIVVNVLEKILNNLFSQE